MNEIRKSCASTDRRQTEWDSIDWLKCEAAVQKLQARIVKAQKEGRHNKVKALQWTLPHSFYAKALAVKRVTSNQGKIPQALTGFYGQLQTQRQMLLRN